MGPGNSQSTSELLLTSDLFHLAYTPRNLYYYGLRNGKLVPYPVFVPIQGKNPAVTLIEDLINGPTGYLGGMAWTAVPQGSHLVPPIQGFPGPAGRPAPAVSHSRPAHPPEARGGQKAPPPWGTPSRPAQSPPRR